MSLSVIPASVGSGTLRDRSRMTTTLQNDDNSLMYRRTGVRLAGAVL
jgi:hypothetical protein